MGHTAAYFAFWIGVLSEAIQVLNAILSCACILKQWLHCFADTEPMELNSIFYLCKSADKDKIKETGQV